VEHLGVADGDLVAGLALHLEADDAGDVLAEVEDEDAGLVFGDGFGVISSIGGPGRRDGDRSSNRAGLGDRASQCGIVEARGGPAGHFERAS
jgi:hypothetical protein